MPTSTSTVIIDANTTVTAANTAISFASLALGDSSGSTSPTLVLSTTTVAAGLVVVNTNATWKHSIASPISVASMTVQSGGVLTQVFSGATSTETAKLNLAVANTFTLQSGGQISLASLGFSGGTGAYSMGFGPGGGQETATRAAADTAGPARTADRTLRWSKAGLDHDSVANPINLGSGGGGGYNNTTGCRATAAVRPSSRR